MEAGIGIEPANGFAGGILSYENKDLVHLPTSLSTQSQIGLPGRGSATRRSRETKFCSRYGLRGKDREGRLNSITASQYLEPACSRSSRFSSGRVVVDRVSLSQIVAQRRERRENFNKRTPGELLALWILLAPGDDVRTCAGSEFLRPRHVVDGNELVDVNAIGRCVRVFVEAGNHSAPGGHRGPPAGTARG
jgi:hypothetical protein